MFESTDPSLPGYRRRGRVWVTTDVADQIDRDEEAQCEQSRKSEEEAAEAKPPDPAPPLSRAEMQRQKEENPFADLEPERFSEVPEGHYPVVHLDGLVEAGMLAARTSTDTQDRKRWLAVGNLLRERGPHRLLRPLPGDWRMSLNRLALDMPNFAAAIDLIGGQLAWAEHRGGPPTLSPLLLVGDPGVGKTRFAEAVAAFFDTSYERVNLETGSNGAHLAGSAANWANTKPGVVFDVLVGGKHANPVILVDEIDKAPHPREYTTPHAALYALWEADSAPRFADASLPMIRLDASRIVWLATANRLEGVPGPLLSRAQVVAVRGLTRSEGLDLASKLFTRVKAELAETSRNAIRIEPLPEAILESLARRSPREMRRLIHLSVGAALYRGRRHVTAEDFAAAEHGATLAARPEAREA